MPITFTTVWTYKGWYLRSSAEKHHPWYGAYSHNNKVVKGLLRSIDIVLGIDK